MTDILQVLMPWKFNGCYALFVIDHGKKHVTFIDFAPNQDWCKHMPYKRFAEAIIIASKKYKIAYSKKRTGWTDDIFKWQHIIQPGIPIDLKEYFLRTIFLEILIFFVYDSIVYNLVVKTLFYRLNNSYLILQAMAMWENDNPMKFVRVSGVRSFHIQTYIPVT
jgi:sentrin-specific protease 1